jgi:NAD(P)-dependent dehydrogenase (short-subunit alcohol dehydrogenase family)
MEQMRSGTRDPQGRLRGKVALVTGVGGGIGKGCALKFAEAGAMVIGCDSDARAAEPDTAPLTELDYEAQWSPTLVGEVDIVFHACRFAWPYLKRSPSASIVNFASVAAFRASMVFGMTAHCAAKGAVLAMTRQLAVEGAPTIRANTISPGLVMTPATQRAFADDETARERMLARIPLRRFGTPEDVAWSALFLASDESSWVTGANFVVDGGILTC